jgi:hypothetical protein
MNTLRQRFGAETTFRIATNRADLFTTQVGDAFLRDALDTFTERLDETSDPDAAWTAVALDQNDNIDGEWLSDIVFSVADSAAGRLIYHGDIVEAYAGVSGWREEQDAADDGLFVEENTIEQRMAIVLCRVAENFIWRLVWILREIQTDLDDAESANEIAVEAAAQDA